MPWYIWLLLAVVLGSIIGGLLMLRAGARKIPLTEEQKQRIAQRNAEADAEDARNRSAASRQSCAASLPSVSSARSVPTDHGNPQLSRTQWLNCSVLLKISPGAMLIPCCSARVCRSLV